MKPLARGKNQSSITLMAAIDLAEAQAEARFPHELARHQFIARCQEAGIPLPRMPGADEVDARNEDELLADMQQFIAAARQVAAAEEQQRQARERQADEKEGLGTIKCMGDVARQCLWRHGIGRVVDSDQDLARETPLVAFRPR